MSPTYVPTSLPGCTGKYYIRPRDVDCKCSFHDGEPNIDHPRHHPFILFMKTCQQHYQVPLITLQKSHQDSMIHSSWVIRHVIEMEDAGMSIHDPFIAYLVALAASIQLELTINDNPKVANAARRKYDKAHAYLQTTAKMWPNVRNIVSQGVVTFRFFLTIAAWSSRGHLGPPSQSPDYQPHPWRIRRGDTLQGDLRCERGAGGH